MKTFQERIKSSLGKELYSTKLNKVMIDYIVDKIIEAADEHSKIAYDRDIKVKGLTNSIISKAEEINLNK